MSNGSTSVTVGVFTSNQVCLSSVVRASFQGYYLDRIFEDPEDTVTHDNVE